ncbi:MAG: hypothetical protein J7K88_07660 [Candidatus Fermentibacteraceae bacterium]|nr:hypothetical protein [Candidatus Fermentibacteraceae bacterium]
MEINEEPVELDKGIVYKNQEEKTHKKKAKVPWVYIAGILGIALIISLLFVNPESSEFIKSPPPEEAAQRDSMYSAATRIQQYMENSDSLPEQADISLPAGFTYEKEEGSFWSLETESGLFYSSDMDLNAFRSGEL